MAEKRFAFRIPEELHKAAKIKAAQTGKSMADVCREALRRWIEGSPPEEQPKKP